MERQNQPVKSATLRRAKRTAADTARKSGRYLNGYPLVSYFFQLDFSWA